MDPSTIAQTNQMLGTMNAEMRSLIQVINKLTKSSSDTVSSMNVYDDTLDGLTRASSDLEDGLKDERMRMELNAATAKKLTLRQQADYNKANKLYQEAAQQSRTTATIQKQLQTATGARAATLQKALQASQLKQQTLQNQAGQAMRVFNGSVTGVTGVVNKLTAVYGKQVLAVIAATNAAIKWAASIQTAAAGNIEGKNIFVALGDAAKKAIWQYGTTTEEFTKIVTAQRQLTNAFGGMGKALEVFGKGSKESSKAYETFFRMTGDGAQALQAMLEAGNNLARKGFKPTAFAMQRYANDLDEMSRRTGMGAAALNTLFEDVANESDSIYQLKAAREDEREAILANQRALIKNNVALGMSAQQASAAAKMLNKMTAAKPLERLKQAAKMRALAGAMGVGGGEEAARAVMAGPRASAEQRAQLMEFNKNLTNKLDQTRGQGLGAEIFATTLVDKLGLEEQYGPSSPFSTTLTEVLAAPLQAIDATGQKHLTELEQIRGILEKAIMNPVQAAVGATSALYDKVLATVGKDNEGLAMAITGLIGAVGALTAILVLWKGANATVNMAKNLGGRVLGGALGMGGSASAAGTAAGAAGSAMDMSKLATTAGGTVAKTGVRAAAGRAVGALGPAGAVAGAGMAGWEIGQWINENTSVQEHLANIIDKVTGLDDKTAAAMQTKDTKSVQEDRAKADEEAKKAADEELDMGRRNLKLLEEMVDINKAQKELQQKTLEAASMTEKEKAEQRDLGERLTAMRQGSTAYKSIA